MIGTVKNTCRILLHSMFGTRTTQERSVIMAPYNAVSAILSPKIPSTASFAKLFVKFPPPPARRAKNLEMID